MKVTSRIRGNAKRNLALLSDQVREKALRSTAYAGAKVLYEEVRLRAPVYDGPPKRGVTPGQLKEAIYHAHSPERSGPDRQVYAISVNKKKAPHWYLIEYGHWTATVGKYGPLQPMWVGPQSYLRASSDAKAQAAVIAMRERFKQRLGEILVSLPKGK